jgi:hypothetical protein
MNIARKLEVRHVLSISLFLLISSFRAPPPAPPPSTVSPLRTLHGINLLGDPKNDADVQDGGGQHSNGGTSKGHPFRAFNPLGRGQVQWHSSVPSMSGRGLAHGLARGPKERGNEGRADDGARDKNSESSHAYARCCHRPGDEIEDDPGRKQVKDANFPLGRCFEFC